MHEFKRRFPPPPSDWSRPLLADIADRVTSRNVERNPNVLTISAELGLISQSEFFRRRVASESVAGYFLLERGDFAYNKSYSRGYPLGAIRRLDRYEKGCVSPLYICFRPRADAVDSDFLLHYLDGGAIDAGLADVAKEGVRNHGLLNVGVTDFFSLEVPLPPVAEQRVTAQVLDTLDTTIRQTEAIIEKLKQVKQGLLHDLLTRGIDANGELRPPHSQAPHLYKDSPLGWIPRGWDVTAVGALVRRVTYGFTSPMPTTTEGPWMLTAADVDDGRINYETARKTAPREFARLSAKSRPSKGDILVTKDGTLGRVAIVDRDDVCVNQSVAVLSPFESGQGVFLALYLRSPLGQERMLADAGGSTIRHIYITTLAQMLVPSPPIPEACEIGAIAIAIEQRIHFEVLEVQKLGTLKSGLMDDLLTGRVRVTPLLRQLQQEVS